MENDKKTLSRRVDFFHKHFLGRKTLKVFLTNSNMFRTTFPVIDSNLTGIRLEADMTETNVNKAVKVSSQSGEGMFFEDVRPKINSK